MCATVLATHMQFCCRAHSHIRVCSILYLMCVYVQYVCTVCVVWSARIVMPRGWILSEVICSLDRCTLRAWWVESTTIWWIKIFYTYDVEYTMCGYMALFCLRVAHPNDILGIYVYTSTRATSITPLCVCLLCSTAATAAVMRWALMSPPRIRRASCVVRSFGARTETPLRICIYIAVVYMLLRQCLGGPNYAICVVLTVVLALAGSEHRSLCTNNTRNEMMANGFSSWMLVGCCVASKSVWRSPGSYIGGYYTHAKLARGPTDI